MQASTFRFLCVTTTYEIPKLDWVAATFAAVVAIVTLGI